MIPHPAPMWNNGQFAAMDIMMNCGQRRPNWSRVGDPSPREMSDMMAWRLHVLAGAPSISGRTASPMQRNVVPPARTGADSRSFSAQAGAKGKLKRPPGIPDDHPLVLQGRME